LRCGCLGGIGRDLACHTAVALKLLVTPSVWHRKNGVGVLTFRAFGAFAQKVATTFCTQLCAHKFLAGRIP
jgi:type 1 glutamine amidotransferase